MKKFKIFISGKVTGNEYYKEDFEMAKKHAKDMYKDAEIVCPTDRDLTALTHEEAMKITLGMLEDCNAILLLESWNCSNGAKEELKLALEKGMHVITQYSTETPFGTMVGYGTPAEMKKETDIKEQNRNSYSDDDELDDTKTIGEKILSVLLS